MKVLRRILATILCLVMLSSVVAITVFASEGILGDANEDGKVNVKDATFIQKYAATIITLTDSQLKASDVNADEKVNIKDATAIQKWIAGLLADSDINNQIVSPSEPETEPVTEPTTAPTTEVPTDPETSTTPSINSGDYSGYNSFMEGFTDIRITDEESAIEAVGSVADVLGITDVERELKVKSVNTIDGDSFYRMQQYYNDIPVYGSNIVVSADDIGNATAMTSNYINYIESTIGGTYGSEQCLSVVEQNIENDLILASRIGEKTYVENEQNILVLCYPVQVKYLYAQQHFSKTFYVSTFDLSIIKAVDHIDNNISVSGIRGENKEYDLVELSGEKRNNNYLLFDDERKIYCGIMENGTEQIPDNGATSEDSLCVDAFVNMQTVYDYFNRNLQIDSFDNKGSGLILMVSRNGYLYDQAKSALLDSVDDAETLGSVEYLGYGIILLGEPDKFFDLSPVYALDILAHEYTHRIVNNVVVLDNNGIDEGISDIFGNLCEIDNDSHSDVWKLGEKTGYSKYDMSESVTMSNYDSSDDGHDNASIISHAAYLMWNGIDGTENRKIDSVTLSKLWYRSLNYLQSNANFIQCRNAVELAARTMLKKDKLTNEQYKTVVAAFDRVGIENTATTFSETVQNKFDITVLSVDGTENVNYNLKVKKIPKMISGPGIDNGPITVLDENSITGCKSLDLENGLYILEFSDLSDKNSISETIYIVIKVDGNNPRAKNNLVVNTDFTDVIVVGIDDNTIENDNASVHLSEYYYSNEGFMDIYKPKLMLNSDDTFIFVENLAEGMGTYIGTYQVSGDQLQLSVTSTDFYGFRGEDVELINLTINDKNTLTLNTDLCLSREGDIFSCGVSADRNSIEQEIISTYGLSSEEQFVSCVGSDIQIYPESIYGVLSMTWLDIDNDNNEELVVVRVAKSDNGSEAQIVCEVFSEENGEYSCTASSEICTLYYNMASYIYLYYSNELKSYCLVTDSSYTGAYTGVDSSTAQVFTIAKNSVCEYANWSVVPSFGISTDFGVEFSKTGVPFAKNCTIYDKTSETVYYQPLCEVKHEVYGDAYVYSDRTHKLCVSAFSEDNILGNGTYAVGCDDGTYYWTYSESNVNPEYTLVFENNNGDIKELYKGATRGEIYLLDDTLTINQHLYGPETSYIPQYSVVVLSAEGELIKEIPDFLVEDIDESKDYYVLRNYYHTDLYDTSYYIYSIDDSSFAPAPWSDEDVHFVNANNGIVYYYVNTDDDRGVILYSYSVENECSEELSTSYIEYYDSGPGYGSSPCTIYHLQETENTIYYSIVYIAGTAHVVQRAKLVMYDKVSGKNIELTDDIYEIGADFYVYIENGVEKVICYNDNLNSNVIISDRGNSIEATDKNVQLIGKPYSEGGIGVDVPHYLYLDDSGDNIQILPATSVDNADDYVIVYIENVCYTGKYTYYDIDYHKLNPNSGSWRDYSITDKLETYRYDVQTGETELICTMNYE